MINASTIARSSLLAVLFVAAFELSAQAQGPVLDPNNTAKIIPGQILLDDATLVIQEAKHDPGMQSLIFRAKAIFIVPRYEDSSISLAARAHHETAQGLLTPVLNDLSHTGSPGVFLMHRLSAWSSPAFFTIVQGSIYAKDVNDLYRSGTPLVMVFNSDRAARELQGCPAGSCWLTDMSFATYTDDPRASLADADVVVWSRDRDANAATLHNDYIRWRDLATNAIYENQATLWQILSNQVGSDRAHELQTALSTYHPTGVAVASSELTAPRAR
jgi:hypothetical protein